MSEMITVYITDARDEYARTMFEKIGLPPGASVKLRYSAKWIEPKLRQELDANKLPGRIALLCFMNGNRGDLQDAKAVACRYARILKSEKIASFVNIDCQVLGFPHTAAPKELFASADSHGLTSPGPREGLFIVNAEQLHQEPLDRAGPDRWGNVAEELSKCSFFRTASFVYWERLSNSRGREIACQNGIYKINATSAFTARIHTLAITKESRLHQYEIRVDGTLLEVISDPEISVAFGREFFDLRFTTLSTDRTRLTRIRLAPGTGENGSFFVVPLEIITRKVGLMIRRSAIAISGAAAATAGVLPSAAPIGVRIGLIVLGSIGLGLSTRPSS